MAEAVMLQCYNKGCGNKFNIDNNQEGSCHHHPGVPVFHDALKGWSCCKKCSTDFTEFLNTPGCTHGLHSNEKPKEVEPEKANGDTTEEVIVVPPVVHKPIESPMERPSSEEPMVRLKNTVGASLQQGLEKQLKEMNLETNNKNTETDAFVVQPGTACKNAGCTKSYCDETSNTEVCIYHAGVPIFHEGMKYWSCCQRKTSDFSSFLSQEGCSTGTHLWFKKESEEQKVACRVDWHQTAPFITISIFAKMSLPDKSYVETNKVSTKVKFVFEGGKKQFEKLFILNGVIDPALSTVKMLGTKVEINLKKLEPGSWKLLELPAS